jgi:hypothetical protein
MLTFIIGAVIGASIGYLASAILLTAKEADSHYGRS